VGAGTELELGEGGLERRIASLLISELNVRGVRLLPDAQDVLIAYVRAGAEVLRENGPTPENLQRTEESTYLLAALLVRQARRHRNSRLSRNSVSLVARKFLCHFPFCKPPKP
jgi:hypothetical protein